MARFWLTSAIVASTLTLAGGALAGEAAPEKKLSVGGDLQFVLPVGDFSDATGPLIGPVVRVGYRVAPAAEVTGRIGFLYGISKSETVDTGLGTVSVSYGVNDIPVWIGGRYFFMQPDAGLYGAAEVGLNVLKGHADGGGTSGNSQTRFGFDVGVGYVISPELPIDFRLQFTHFNLLGTETGEKSLFGLGLSAGYTASF
jgi:hypothetical protein